MAWNLSLPTANWYTLNDPRLESVVREAEAQSVIAIDTETTGLVVWKDVPLYWSLCWGEKRMCMPISTISAFRHIFKDPTKSWVFANAKFDMHMLANVGVSFAGKIIDTQVMHALLYEEQSHALKDMAKQVLGWRWLDFFDTFKPKNIIVTDALNQQIRQRESIQEVLTRIEKEDLPTLVEYASNDAYGTMRIYEKLKAELENSPTFSLYDFEYKTLADIFFKTEVPFTKVLFKCERNGSLIDKEYLSGLCTPMQKELDRIEREIVSLAGKPINPNSTMQLRTYFIEERKLKPLKLSSGGKSGVRNPSVDADFLEHYSDDPVAKLLLEHRELSKLLGTYARGLTNSADNNDRIHPRFNQDIARSGRLSSSNPNCLHPDTEVLTPFGWVRVSELKKGEQVAQWENGEISFVAPTAYIRTKSDEIVHISNQHIRLAVTPDHRCLLRHRKTGELRVFSASDYPSDWQHLHAGILKDPSTTHAMSASFLRLLVAVQADGHYRDSGIDFAFKKLRKIKRLCSLLSEMGAAFSCRAKDSRGRTRIRILAGPVVENVRNYLGPYKEFGSWLLCIGAELRSVFCAEVFFWDGSWTRKNNYSSNSKNNAKWVQTMMALSGQRAHFRKYTIAADRIPNWQVDVTPRDYSMTTNVKMETLPYDGEVYCVSVPSSFLLIRYEEEISVTGNCQNIPRAENDKFRMRGAFIAGAGHQLIVSDFEQLEMRLLASASMEDGMIDIFRRNWDIHMGNAALVFGPKHGLTYEEIEQAKKIDKKVKAGELPEGAMTERVQLALFCRQAAKSVGFGLNYGMKENKLARQIGCTVEEAVDMIDAYMERYPAVKQFYAEAIAETEKTGYSHTILGRRRFLPEVLSLNEYDRWKAQRQAVNNQIQGSAADVCRMAMLLCDESGLEERFGCKMLMQVHDELVFECPDEHVAECREIIKECMEHPFPTDLAVELLVSMGAGKNWLEAK